MAECRTDPFVLIDFSSRNGNPKRTCFTHPLEIIVARSIDEVLPSLRSVQHAINAGLYAAGYVAYEAAPAFDSALHVNDSPSMPLVWFGIFSNPTDFVPAQPPGEYRLSKWEPSVDRGTYDQHIATVREAIAQGDSYQANYTIRMRARFEGDDLAFYYRLLASQQTKYGAYINTGRYRILSVSPELFFRIEGLQITTCPMKGTVRRGRWSEEDELLSAWLLESEKNRAENVMIVDLLRNDLGRVAKTGSIHVPSQFKIERYPTVFQMTSTVTATLHQKTTLEEVFSSLFPSGSVTGAPKVSTMRLIKTLEESPRNVYCGAIGIFEPGGRAVFNVAIRTVVIDVLKGSAEYGVGGGITWNSTADEEYDEALAKAAILSEQQTSFELLETMRLENGNYFLLESHLDRLAASGKYFDIPVSIQQVRAKLEEHANLHSSEVRRVRLLVSQSGVVKVGSEAIDLLSPLAQSVAIAEGPVSKQDRFLYHKTTQRRVYDEHRAKRTDVYDVLLFNEDGELTEFTTGNLVLESEDVKRWTPPLRCGLLGGVFRAHLISRGEIGERVLTRKDLATASRCWLVNSVRGWVPVALPS